MSLTTIGLGIKYKQDYYPNEQNDGFYPSYLTVFPNLYPQNNPTIPIYQFQTIFLEKAYQKESDPVKYIPEDHSNPFNVMSPALPINLGNISINFGAQVPFTINETEEVVIKQFIVVEIAVVDDLRNVIFNYEYSIIQNETHNQLFRSVDFSINSDEFQNPEGNYYRSETNFTLYRAIMDGYVLENGTERFGAFYERIFTFDRISGEFKIEKLLIPFNQVYDFSILWKNQTTDSIILFFASIPTIILIYFTYKGRNEARVFGIS